MVRVRVAHYNFGTYGYLMQDKYSSHRGRSIQKSIRLSNEEVEDFENGKITAQELLKRHEKEMENLWKREPY